MKKCKKFTAFVMASVLGVAAISDTNIVRAKTTAQETGQEQEYVVLAKNDKGIEQVEENFCGEEIVKEQEELEGNHIAVVELTEAEVVRLERDRNILLVEEDILFEGSILPGGVQDKIQLEEVDFEETEIEEIEPEETEQKETEPEEIGLKDLEKSRQEETEIEKSYLEENSTEEADGTDFTAEEKKEMEMLLESLESEEEAIASEDQWNIDAIHANDQKYIQAGDQVKIAVMDTGVTLSEDIEVAGRINLIE